MSTKQNDTPGAPIESKSDLVAWFARGEKPSEAWRIGTEHEKFGYRVADTQPIHYDGPSGIAAILDCLSKSFGWMPIAERGLTIALRSPGSSAVVSLEPGGQLELSGAPLATIHETKLELEAHLEELRQVAQPLGVAFAGLGHAPTWPLGMTPLMPKGRYTIMKQYMPRVGTRGLDMMYRTATVQVNLDYSSERDMVRKYRVSLALQPVVSALFANSPFVEGLPSGLKSARCWVWLDTDADRCGIPSFVFDESMSYERYVDYALGVPMYFVYRDGKYIDVAGSSFNSFLQGALPQLPGQLPTMADWIDHTSTLFPDVRLKQYLEMRGADSGGRPHLCALPALWTGLLYDSTSLDESIALIEQFTLEDIENARTSVPTEGLQARLGRVRVLDVARDVLEIAQAGLRRRRCLNAEGLDESIFLRGLQLSVATGMSPADVMMEKFENGWNRDATMALFHEAL